MEQSLSAVDLVINNEQGDRVATVKADSARIEDVLSSIYKGRSIVALQSQDLQGQKWLMIGAFSPQEKDVKYWWVAISDKLLYRLETSLEVFDNLSFSLK